MNKRIFSYVSAGTAAGALVGLFMSPLVAAFVFIGYSLLFGEPKDGALTALAVTSVAVTVLGFAAHLTRKAYREYAGYPN